ncbi:MAG: sensor histidine kinase [Gemmatimonadetes bacterium]|nr:sensor histidine kinase [Gemmatimonadota bacterium]
MSLPTHHLPAERATPEEVRRQCDLIASHPLAREFLDTVPNMAVVLNDERQIVFANRSFLAFLEAGKADALSGTFRSSGAHDAAAVLGLRAGEALGCSNARRTPGGCGTSAQCQSCGGALAIKRSQESGELDIQECRVVCGAENEWQTALDLRVWSHPIHIDGETFLVYSMVDISNEKRREALEKIFFHDVLNTAAGVHGLAELMQMTEMRENGIRKVAGMLSQSTDQLMSEITAQRLLTLAENGELQVSAVPVRSQELLEHTAHQFHSQSLERGISVSVDATSERCDMVSDPVLLRRVLTNLVKNAVEATDSGGKVTLAARAEGDMVCFTVHNSAVMPEAVQSQVFMRSFSTKGSGRGLGTYSIKLLSERHLHGRVSFVSNSRDGTRFAVRYPKVLAAS